MCFSVQWGDDDEKCHQVIQLNLKFPKGLKCGRCPYFEKGSCFGKYSIKLVKWRGNFTVLIGGVNNVGNNWVLTLESLARNDQKRIMSLIKYQSAKNSQPFVVLFRRILLHFPWRWSSQLGVQWSVLAEYFKYLSIMSNLANIYTFWQQWVKERNRKIMRTFVYSYL